MIITIPIPFSIKLNQMIVDQIKFENEKKNQNEKDREL